MKKSRLREFGSAIAAIGILASCNDQKKISETPASPSASVVAIPSQTQSYNAELKKHHSILFEQNRFEMAVRVLLKAVAEAEQNKKNTGNSFSDPVTTIDGSYKFIDKIGKNCATVKLALANADIKPGFVTYTAGVNPESREIKSVSGLMFKYLNYQVGNGKNKAINLDLGNAVRSMFGRENQINFDKNEVCSKGWILANREGKSDFMNEYKCNLEGFSQGIKGISRGTIRIEYKIDESGKISDINWTPLIHYSTDAKEDSKIVLNFFPVCPKGVDTPMDFISGEKIEMSNSYYSQVYEGLTRLEKLDLENQFIRYKTSRK